MDCALSNGVEQKDGVVASLHQGSGCLGMPNEMRLSSRRKG